MTAMKLYTGGGVSLSPINAEGRHESDYVRLIADDGMMLTNGTSNAICVDVAKTAVVNWNEVPYADPEDEPTEADKAEALDYEKALEELGVDFSD